ncbi:MAG: P-loop NTPase [Spirochaetaceae bacterium]|nr:P-loop NTPase [Spirochaetaceae bacterium]
MASKADVTDALRAIVDPDLNQDIVSLGFVQEVEIAEGHVMAEIRITTPACPVRDEFKTQAERLIGDLPGVKSVTVRITAPEQRRTSPVKESGLEEVSSIIAVASCKGGVGKSTVAAGIACELAQRGHRVGLLDADIFGPSVPTLFNRHDQPLTAGRGNLLAPVAVGPLQVMSFGFWLGDAPAVMRGPMVTNYVQQFLHGVAWEGLDYLLIDLPPGTGDIQLTITQAIQLDGALIVTTPQALALADVGKGIVMFDKVEVPVLGVIENMAWFADGEGRRHQVFGEGGGEALAERFGVPLLCQLPLDPSAYGGTFDAYAGDEGFAHAADTVVRALGRSKAGSQAKPEIGFDESSITVSWEDGSVDRVANRELRANCRCARCVDEFSGEQLLDVGRIPADIRADEVRVVGNYALAVTWSDGHSTGLYPYRTIRSLAAEAA